MTELNSCSELSIAENIYPTQVDTTEVFTSTIAVVGTGLHPILLNAPYNGRISSFNVKAGAGSGVFTVKIGTVNVTGLVDKALSVTEQDYTPTDLNSFIVDQDIWIDVTSATDLTGVVISVSVLREIGTAIPVTVTTDLGDSTSAAFLEKVTVAFPQGFAIVNVPFGTTKLDENGDATTNYTINYEPPENLTDAVPDRIFPTVVEKTPTGIKLLLSGVPTTSNTIFRATIATAAAATNILSTGSPSGSGSSGIISSTSLPLRGDSSGNAIAIGQQTGDAATGLATLNLFSSTPTYDSAKLTGTIDQARLGSGSTGSGTKVLYDDQTFKTVSSLGGGDVASDTIFDTKGDLAVATGPDAALKLAAGADSTVLIADSTQTTGLKYAKITSTNVDSANIDGAAGVASMRTLGTGATQSPAGNDARIVGALQVDNNLSEFSATFDDVRINLNFGEIVYESLPDGGPMGLTALQSPSNKYIDANVNTIVNLTSANFTGETTLDLVDPNADRILFWDDSLGSFTWLSGLTITATGITGINGVTDASSAAAGDVGQVISALVAVGSAVSLTTATAANVTSISLTAGDWDVSANINFTAAAATITALTGGINTTSATVPTDGSEVASGTQVTTTTLIDSITFPRKRVNVSGTTTTYLVAKATFSAGTVAGYGAITARRIR